MNNEKQITLHLWWLHKFLDEHFGKNDTGEVVQDNEIGFAF